MGIKILTDSGSDLSNELLKQYDIDNLPLVVIKGEEEYLDGVTISSKTVYDGMREGVVFKTSQVPARSFEEKFEEYAKNKDSVIYLAFSSQLSGTYQVSIMVRDQMLERYPEFDIEIIDTKAASMGLGLIVLKAAKLAKEGKSKEEILEAIEFYLDNIEHVFTVDDLEYLFRGGRVSKTQAFVGGLLNIKPVLNVEDGRLIPLEKVRGKNKVYKTMLDIMGDRTKEADLTKQVVGISHADDIENATKLKDLISDKFGTKEFVIGDIGSTIGAHVGPGTLAIFFLKKNYN
ncbi:MAG: DegV family protein [Tissierellaceae bacterium]|nr:DegV family protein [Tissierellaceae bacterium]